MKLASFTALVLTAVLVFSLTGCGKKSDADVLMREAKTNAGTISSCSASFQNVLEFSADGKQNQIQLENEIIYHAKPFSLKSIQTSRLNQTTSNSTTYNMTDANGIWFYSQTDGVWQKTSAGSIDTTPFHQIDILRLLDSVKSQKYVREVNLGSGKAHKLELTFRSEVLQSTVENIVTATGLAKDSATIVQTLLDSAGDVYGYCYINESTGEIAQLDLDLTQAVNKVFQNIDGSSVKITVTQCSINGKIENIGKAPTVKLPPQAEAAANVQAKG